MLSGDDRDWLEGKFNRVHERMDGLEQRIEKKGSDIHRVDLALAKHENESCKDVAAHEDKYHNPAKTWGIIAAIIGVVTGILEVGKWLFKGGVK